MLCAENLIALAEMRPDEDQQSELSVFYFRKTCKKSVLDNGDRWLRTRSKFPDSKPIWRHYEPHRPTQMHISIS